MARTLDPISVEILWSRLINIVDEAAATLVRTSFSGIVRDSHDYACVLFDGSGRLLAQSTQTTPGLIGSIPETIRNILKLHPREWFAPGDVVITNDPWLGTGHLPDITLASPIFQGAALVGFAGCVVHHTDIGGRMATGESRDVFEEGLQIPVSKFCKGGVLDEDIAGFIRSNVRVPEKVMGDLRAQLAALHVMTGRVLEMLAEEGFADLGGIAEAIISRTESALRRAIAELPDGTWSAEVTVDPFPAPDGGPGETIRLKGCVTIHGDHVRVDFDGTSAQVSKAVNCCLNFTRSHTAFAVRAAISPGLPNNEGAMRPIAVEAPEGSVLNCRRPAPVYGRTEVGHYCAEVVFLALAPVVAERVVAGCGGNPLWGVYLYGFAREGKPFLLNMFFHGGMGAASWRDGYSCRAFPANLSSVPVEVMENTAPIICERRRMTLDSGGAGEHRGGLGQELVLKVLEGSRAPHGALVASLKGGRFSSRTPGLAGGGAAGPSRLLLNGKPTASRQQILLKPGDVLACYPNGGGGFGDPLARAPEKVEEDVRNGLVSVGGARALYGVVIDGATMRVDRGATQALRLRRGHEQARAGRAGGAAR